jgi:hypothetical protein
MRHGIAKRQALKAFLLRRSKVCQKPWLIDLMAISHFFSEILGKSLRKTEFLPL